MKPIPVRARTFSELLPPSLRFASTRRFLGRAATALLGALSLGQSATAGVAGGATPAVSPAIVIENRSRKAVISKLVLRLGNAAAFLRSGHVSHASHSSHSSHASHASHYSSSGGSATPPSPAPSAPPESSTTNLVQSEHHVRLTITGIDLKAHKITGRDPLDAEWVFYYQPDVDIRLLRPTEHVTKLNHLSRFPLHWNNKVTIRWKDADKVGEQVYASELTPEGTKP